MLSKSVAKEARGTAIDGPEHAAQGAKCTKNAPGSGKHPQEA